MSDLTQAPRGNRIHIAFFGLRNAGKSTLVNAFCSQSLAIVSPTPGTTTDPVSKAMEILPLGPCLITDTAGLDDEGELGAQRVEKTLEILNTTDIAVWVRGESESTQNYESDEFNESNEWAKRFFDICKRKNILVFEYRRGEDVEELKKKIAEVKLEEKVPGLLDGLVQKGDRVICVCPIDSSAPKGRLILPQVQVIRECLDLHVPCTVVQPDELEREIRDERLEIRDERLDKVGRVLVITDSQAMEKVKQILPLSTSSSSLHLNLTTFSILFARQKGDFAEFVRGVKAIKALKDGDTVLISEACTHRRHCEDIGTTKIPKAVMALSGCQKLNFAFSSGATFNPDTMRSLGTHASLIVHCGGCMLTRRELLHRIALAKAAKVPIVNYGVVLSAAAGMTEFNENGIIGT